MDPRPYCPRSPWQLSNHATLHLNTQGHSPELTAPPTIDILEYLLAWKNTGGLIMGLIISHNIMLTSQSIKFRLRTSQNRHLRSEVQVLLDKISQIKHTQKDKLVCMVLGTHYTL